MWVLPQNDYGVCLRIPSFAQRPGDRMSCWRLPVHPHPVGLEGEQDPVLCEKVCCELCVRSYVCSVILVVVGGIN